MAKEKIEQEVPAQENKSLQAPKTKKIRNRGNSKVELLIDNKVVVVLPRETAEVPIDFDVPNGIGLYVRE